jgi:spermidine/putrescine transport system substrate-binding protein
MRGTFFFKMLLRLCIIIVWLCVLLFFLYKPWTAVTGTVRSLSILTWPQVIDGQFLENFEKKYGVQIHITYCENNEEMLAKLQNVTDHGYDIAMPSHFFLDTFIKEGLIKPLDKKQIHFFDKIHPQLKALSFDPENQYTIPCFWSVYGIGIDMNYFKNIPFQKSWGLIFDECKNCPLVGMMEDIPQLFSIAGLYFFNKTKGFSADEIQSIKTRLIAQKKRVVAYTDMRVEYLIASGECPLVLSTSSDMAKMVKEYPHISFFVPREGSFTSLDSFTITTQTTQESLVYSFLNYLYEEGIISLYAQKFDYPSPLIKDSDQFILKDAAFTASVMPTLYNFNRELSQKEYEKLWVAIRAAK